MERLALLSSIAIFFLHSSYTAMKTDGRLTHTGAVG